MSNTETSDRDIKMGFETLRLHTGAIMQIQSMADSNQARHSVKFIGYIKDSSVLVTLPFQDGKGIWMQPGQTHVVRGFNGRYAYAFTTKVIRARERPFTYVHFSWPQSIECQLVRNSFRVDVSLQVNVSRSDNTPVTATLLDLSASGAMINSSEELGSIGNHIQIGLLVDLDGNSVSMNIPAVIRNVHQKEDGTGFKSGLGFEDINQNDRLILHYFINSVTQNK